jgi:hypothetical protein
LSTPRLCLRCNFEKDVSSFPVDKRNLNWKNNICKACRWKKTNENNRKTKAWNKYNWKKYGIEDLEEAFRIYNTEKSCNICGSSDKLHLDHCHSSKKVRGMLCHKCNRALGFFNDSSETLRKAAEYIDNTGKMVYH